MTEPEQSGLRKRRRSFVQIPSETIRDRTLSFRARGVLAWILDHPDGWDVRSVTLANEGKEGRDAIRAALVELAEGGYYRLERRRMPGGRFAMATAVSEEPVPEWAAEYRETKGQPQIVVLRDGEWVRDTPPGGRFPGPGGPGDGAPGDGGSGASVRESRQTVTNPPADAGAPTLKQPTRERRRSRCPEDWRPTVEQIARAKERSPSIDIDHEVEQFRNYHIGRGTLAADWGRTWATWVGNHAERARRLAQSRQGRAYTGEKWTDGRAAAGWDEFERGDGS